MNYLSRLYKIKSLFGIVCLGLIALVAFQVHWLLSSKNMIEEQFDQKVNMAVGSAITEFNSKYQTELDVKDFQNCAGNDYKYVDVKSSFMTPARQLELEENLKWHMMCFGIEEKYSVAFFDGNCEPEAGAYCCSISTMKASNLDFKLGVSFASRNDYLFDKMKFMILSSILIFFVLAAISFITLNALVKQKRITENNIDFFNNTAHEIKTPLTNISLAINLLQKKYPAIANDKYASILRAENKKLIHQVERVMFLSKIESGEHQMEKRSINIYDLLNDVVERMSFVAEEKGGTIELKSDRKDISVIGDEYHLSNVFYNLLDNALKYCDKAPKIDISISQYNDQISVRFDDNGIGISKHDQLHIFEKFQRVNTGDIRNVKGFGIGLSYVKKVIEMHRGLINVYSELNKGSRFELIIPYA